MLTVLIITSHCFPRSVPIQVQSHLGEGRSQGPLWNLHWEHCPGRPSRSEEGRGQAVRGALEAGGSASGTLKIGRESVIYFIFACGPPGIWLALPHPGDKEQGGALSNWPFEMHLSHPPEGPFPAPAKPPHPRAHPPQQEDRQSWAAECLLTTGCHQHRPGLPSSAKNASRGQKWDVKPEAGFSQRRRSRSGGRAVMDPGHRGPCSRAPGPCMLLAGRASRHRGRQEGER